MKILIAHPQGLGPFQQLATALARDPAHELVFISQRPDPAWQSGGRWISYTPARPVTAAIHGYLAETEAAVLNAQQVVRALHPLKQAGFVPDLMLGHNGSGEIWYLKDLFPGSPLLGQFDFFHTAEGADIGFDPEQVPDFDLLARTRTRNLGNLLGLDSVDAGQCATAWQRGLFPAAYQHKLHIVHEGVDTEVFQPNPRARLNLEAANLSLAPGDELLTFFAPSLEPCYGFGQFMRSLPAVLAARPQARVFVLGNEQAQYGAAPANGATWLAVLRAELGDSVDWSRVHFLGEPGAAASRVLLQLSRVHVQLSYPLPLARTVLEAMACEALVVAANTAPLREVISHGDNGLLVDFFNVNALAATVIDALAHPELHADRRRRARQTIIERYDFRRICLPAQLKLWDELRAGRAAGNVLPLPVVEPAPAAISGTIEELMPQALSCFDRRDYNEALRLGQQMLALEPGNEAGTHICGLAWLRRGEAGQALPLLEQTIRHKPRNGLVHFQLAQALLATGEASRAITYFDSAQALGVVDAQLEQQRYDAAGLAFQHRCDWLNYDRVQRLVRQSIVSSGRWIVGESTLASPYFGNAQLLRATRNHARSLMAGLPSVPGFKYEQPKAKICLGFVGCDFFEQATAYLMVGFIEALDREQFDVLAYDHGASRPDTPFRQRVHKAYDQIVDITELSDEQAAERIHADGIDVLFSIKNPASARLGIFARRPAAIQVHYLYYPGSSGMPFFDYVVADDIVIPSGAEGGYSERVLRLAGCYQPNDRERVRANDTPLSQWGLPDDAVVLANFSQTYKFTPSVFDLWCQLLDRDPRRVLWLLSSDAKEQASLRREAQSRGIAPQRLYFTHKQITQQHLDRLRRADLVLDTYPYGGHTLGSDALWAGTPVLTLCGETYASRVAASLLHAVGMDELVAHNDQEYLDKGEALLGDENNRRRWRRHLDEGRDHFSLFDPEAYAKNFAVMIREAVARHWAAESGHDIVSAV